jgi:hypothetical protein
MKYRIVQEQSLESGFRLLRRAFLFEIFPYESDEPGLHSCSVTTSTTSYFKKTAVYSVLQIKEAMKV